ncbi:MAG: HPr kinase/phosphorylase [Hyphomicrobiaceae bacterium]
MGQAATELLHGTSIAFGERAALLTGPPGSGKSDLALRCLALGRSAVCPVAFQLVSDDQTLVTVADFGLAISAPDTIFGKMEVRGLGVVDMPAVRQARLVLRVDLVAGPVERMPDLRARTARILDHEIYRIVLNPFEFSAPEKLAMTMQLIANDDPSATRI